MYILKACPFCGFNSFEDLSDILYPSGSYWREEKRSFGLGVMRSYHSHRDSKPGDQQVWSMNCTENMGGCGAEICADSREEVIERWNRRTPEVDLPTD